MRLFIYMVLVTLAAAASADVYRSVDENGNIIYSDTPSEGAEKIELREAQTVESQPGTESFRYEPPESKPPPRYKEVAITSPQNDEAIRANSGNITISMSVNPSLRPGDSLVLTMDGKEIASGRSTSVSLENVDRGTHSLSARVVGRGGKTLASSEPVKFHLLRHSVQHPNPGN
ncbi:MAG: DUF4124 domain-containing protein [Gammaproteobacteria bacterium]